MTHSPLVRLLLASLTTAYALAPAPAHAQECEDGDACYNDGIKSYIAGDFPGAILAFQKGYGFDSTGDFLANIAVCYGRLSNYEKALQFAERADTHDNLPERDRKLNDARIPAFSIGLSATKVAVEFERLNNAANANDNTNNVIIDPGPKTDAPTFGALGYTGVAMTVIGAGLLTSSLVPNAVVKRFNECQTGDRTDCDDLPTQEEAEQTQRVGLVLLGSGGGLALIGVTMTLIDAFNGPNKTARRLEPMLLVTPDSAYTGLRFRF